MSAESRGQFGREGDLIHAKIPLQRSTNHRHSQRKRSGRSKFGGMCVSDVARLREFEDENRRLTIMLRRSGERVNRKRVKRRVRFDRVLVLAISSPMPFVDSGRSMSLSIHRSQESG